MIQKESILSAIGLAEMLAEKGQVVVARPSTIIAEMVKLTNEDLLTAEMFTDPPMFAEQLEAITTGTLEAPSSHDLYTDEVIHQVGKAVLNHISFAKNTVKPLVVDYAEGVIEYLSNFKFPAACDQFNVVVADLPELLEDESFVGMLNKYTDKTIINPSVTPSLGVKTGEELLTMMLIGDREADMMISAWFSRLGNDFFVNLWENLFRANQPDRAIINFVDYGLILSSDIFDRADYALAIYLLANKLYDVVDEDVNGMNLNAYKDIIAQTRDFAGSILANAVTRVSGFEKSKILVVGNDSVNQRAKVYGKVYRNWLANGGTIETILGLIVSGRSVSTQDSVDEIGATLTDTWSTHSAFFTAAESNKRFDYFKDALTIKFKEIMSSLTEAELEFANATADYMVAVDSRFLEEMQKLRSSEMDDVYAIALKLMCRSRFYYTDAERILSDIAEAARVNPNVDVREAALIATINYVADYVAAQMAISSV
jgi:hypothetical protein